MKSVLACAFSLAILTASGAVLAQQSEQPGVAKDAVIHESCFGDRYESDADMNDGNRVTEEEIRRVLNPPRS
jgi:hypothetical protein